MRHVEQATTVSRQSTLTSAATIVAALPWADRTATITASVTNQKGCISRLSSYGHGTEVVALADCGVHHSFLRMSKVARCSYRDTCGATVDPRQRVPPIGRKPIFSILTISSGYPIHVENQRNRRAEKLSLVRTQVTLQNCALCV